jgi:hypothetical protein
MAKMDQRNDQKGKATRTVLKQVQSIKKTLSQSQSRQNHKKPEKTLIHKNQSDFQTSQPSYNNYKVKNVLLINLSQIDPALANQNLLIIILPELFHIKKLTLIQSLSTLVPFLDPYLSKQTNLKRLINITQILPVSLRTKDHYN